VRHNLAPETTALLHGIAAMQGNELAYVAVGPDGPAADNVPRRLMTRVPRIIAGEPSVDRGQRAFVSFKNLSTATELAPVDAQRLEGAIPRIQHLSSVVAVLGKFLPFKLDITDEHRKSLSEVPNNQAAPSETRAFASILLAEDWIFMGESADARAVLEPLIVMNPASRLILQHLVLLELIQQESTAPKNGGLDPVSDLQIRLIESRHSEAPPSSFSSRGGMRAIVVARTCSIWFARSLKRRISATCG
jgi:hypothetical protein